MSGTAYLTYFFCFNISQKLPARILAVLRVLATVKLLHASFHVVQELLAPGQQTERFANHLGGIVVIAPLYDTLNKKLQFRRNGNVDYEKPPIVYVRWL